MLPKFANLPVVPRKFKMYLVYSFEIDYNKEKPTYEQEWIPRLWSHKPSGTDENTILVAEWELDFEIPDPAKFRATDEQIDILRNKIQTVKADAYAETTKLEGKIQNLLAIGYDDLPL